MDTQKLLQETGEFLRDYMPKFALEGQDADMQHIPHQGRVDMLAKRAKQLYRSLKLARLVEFQEALKDEHRLYVIDLASYYGERFGITIARKNKNALVEVYNPEPLPLFEWWLFEDAERIGFKGFEEEIEFAVDYPEASINALYDANRLYNIMFKKKSLYLDDLDKIAEENSSWHIVIYSHKTPAVPREMTHQIAAVVAKHPHVDMILNPFANDDIHAYSDDSVIRLINEHRRNVYRYPDENDAHNLFEDGRSRIFAMINQYYALKVAELSGGKVYRTYEYPTNDVFSSPAHYVSTIEPVGT